MNRNLTLGFSLVGLVLAATMVGALAVPRDPLAMDIGNRVQPPGAAHFFGTDQYGRDIFSRVLAAGLPSLAVALGAVAIGLGAGGLAGALSGLHRGLADELLMRAVDAMLTFPAILFALMVVAVRGPGNLNTALAIGLVNIPVFARLTRGSVLSLREEQYVEAARALGATNGHILLRHLLPGLATPLVIQASLSVSTAVLAEAALSYLGLGVQPPDPSWGRMIGEAQSFLGRGPWMAVFPGLAIAVTVLGFNLLGDGLRDRLDPHTR
ncbi:MAG: ABC transporter permease [bacterium]|nr:ABC transporter permease [bacterium]